MELTELTLAGLDSVIGPACESPDSWRPVDGRPVVLDFYVPWCKPCQALAPVLEELAEEYSGKVDFYTVNIDQERRVAVRFKVKNVPALVFQPLDRPYRLHVGAMTKAALREAIEAMIHY